MAISEAKKNLIRRGLALGYSINQICEEAKVCKSTVIKYKQQSPAAVLDIRTDTGDASIKYDNSKLLSKKEEIYTKKLKDQLNLYEDDEEGWYYHLTKEDYRLKQSGLWWSAIAYPESVSPHWIDKLRARGFEIAISPLHDKDWWDHDSPEMIDIATGEIIPAGARYKRGDRKKPHWHIIIKVQKRISFTEINNIVRPITGGPYLQKCLSLKGQYEYFLHLNHPNKYQGYDKDEIQTYNDFHIEPTKYEMAIMQNEVLNAIRDNEITELWQLHDIYKDQVEYIGIIAAKPGIFTALIHSMWLLKHPEGKVQRVRLITDDNIPAVPVHKNLIQKTDNTAENTAADENDRYYEDDEFFESEDK